MHIGLIVPGFSADEQDWCIPVVLHLVRRLTRDHDVTIIALRYPSRIGPYRVAGADVYALGGADVAGARRGLLLANALARLLRIGRAKRFDVLHALWADEPGFLAVTAGRVLGVPSLVSVMGGELVAFAELGYGGYLSVLNRLLSGLALRNATTVTVGSRYLERLVQPLLPERMLQRLALGIEPDFFTPAGPQIDLGAGPQLLAVGGLVPIKGQALLIQALAQIQGVGAPAQLHLVGTGPQQAKLSALAEQLGVAQQVLLHGAVPHAQLPEYYRAADLCLLGSRYESQCMAVVEAAACGRMTAGAAVGILPELGIPTPPGDAQALATLVSALLAHPEQLRASGMQRRLLVEQRYTLAHTVQTLERLYQGK
jgi:glycosyltransferase involved in cell wall biosynthesis